MRILILGGDGMLGHQLLKQLGPSNEVRVTLRQDLSAYSGVGQFNNHNAYAGVDVRFTPPLLGVLADFHPEAVINAVGIVKQRASAAESIPSIEINALLPHRLAVMCKAIGARLVHMSTDCVFSGNRGHYTEADPSDAQDLYGKSKFLGEVHEAHALTLRTSIIGTELSRKQGLLEWFLAQKGTVNGFRNAIFSGFTTLEMARIIEKVLAASSFEGGVYHVSSNPISKFDLLTLIKQALRLPVEIIPDDEIHCDRSLDSSRFRLAFGYTPPTWEAMARELAQDILGSRK